MSAPHLGTLVSHGTRRSNQAWWHIPVTPWRTPRCENCRFEPAGLHGEYQARFFKVIAASVRCPYTVMAQKISIFKSYMTLSVPKNHASSFILLSNNPERQEKAWLGPGMKGKRPRLVFWLLFLFHRASLAKFLQLRNGVIQLGDLRYSVPSLVDPHIVPETYNLEIWQTRLLCKVNIT